MREEPFLTPLGYPAPRVTGFLVSDQTGDPLGLIDLQGKRMASLVLENGYRLTLFDNGKVIADPPKYKVSSRRRGYVETVCVPAPAPVEYP